MVKGLTDAARQMIATYPSRQEITYGEWLVEIERWAEDTKARLDALRITGTPWRFIKTTKGDAQSLTPEELETAIKTILKCTDLPQLKRIGDALRMQMQPLIMRFRGRRFQR